MHVRIVSTQRFDLRALSIRALSIRALSSAALLCACSTSDPPPAALGPLAEPLLSDIDADGPFAVGYLSFETTYAAPTGGDRTIFVNVWYPTEEIIADPPQYDIPKYQSLFPDPDVFSNAPAARPAYDGTYPIVVHSHGFRGWGGNSSDLLRHFATHGWVVVAPDHKDNTLLNPVDPLPPAHFFQRPLDVRAALDALATGAVTDFDPATLDFDSVLMTGHSFGTYTCWASAGAAYDAGAVAQTCATELDGGPCSSDEVEVFTSADLSEARVRATIPMAGGYRAEWFGASGHGGVTIPMMMMTGDDDSVDGQAVFDMVGDVDFTWIDVAGGCHQLFGLGDCAQIANQEGFRIVNAHALAYARYHVLDDQSVAAVVDGTESVDDRVTFTKK